MKLYEGMLKILEEKGPIPISTLCNEANNMFFARENPILPVQVKSILTKKKDLFSFNDDIISIHPDKQLSYLSLYSDAPGRPSYQVRVDFNKGRFIFIEWHERGTQTTGSFLSPKPTGDLDAFKTEIYKLKIWDWMPQYVAGEGIVLGGTSWTVKLKTKGAVYKSSGVKKFPAKWIGLCRAVQDLTGSPFY